MLRQTAFVVAGGFLRAASCASAQLLAVTSPGTADLLGQMQQSPATTAAHSPLNRAPSNLYGIIGFGSHTVNEARLADGSSAGAAVDTAEASAQHMPGRSTSDEQADSAGLAAASAEADAAPNDGSVCHLADPYCQAGEEAPRPDDFHEEGDGSTPPSAGFPA